MHNCCDIFPLHPTFLDIVLCRHFRLSADILLPKYIPLYASQLIPLLLAGDSVPLRVPLSAPVATRPVAVRSAVHGSVRPDTVMLQSLAQPMVIGSGLSTSSTATVPCSEYGFNTGRMRELCVSTLTSSFLIEPGSGFTQSVNFPERQQL